jgi:hypothetical protein
VTDKSDHAEALEAYDVCLEAATDNHESYLKEVRFWLLSEQWPEAIRNLRNTPGQQRPMFTLNMGPSFCKQVMNDIRQNRPAIKVRPADSAADIETAMVMSGLIRNIQYASRADIAHDTAAECSVTGGFGYWRVLLDYCTDDSFDQDIRIARISNPLSVLGDPYSRDAGSIDWNVAFVSELYSKDEFEEKWPGAKPVSFSSKDADAKVRTNWTQGEDILTAEWWRRDEVPKKILRLSNGQTMETETYLAPGDDGPSLKDILDNQGVTVLQERVIQGYRVRQCIMNGEEVLNETTVWPGRYIPIVEIVGDEINVQGKRYLRSLIHNAKDAQEQLNYWETTATELVALSPRVPYIGPVGAFKTDPRWASANSANHPYLEYDVTGGDKPERQPLDSGPAIGAMQQSQRAHENMKAIIGMYNASLGQRSNETSGKAIDARKREGDVGSFNFPDNVNRGIQHEGLILMDLIPKVYTANRIVRVLGEDGQAQNVTLGKGQPQKEPPKPNAPEPRIGSLTGIFDLSAGKYDLTVEAGPSYTTQRAETAAVVGELIRANPAMMQIGGDILVSNLDLKDGPELSRRLKKMLPPNLQDQGGEEIPPHIEQMIAMGKEQIALLTEENNKLKQDEAGKVAAAGKIEVEKRKLDIEEKKIPAIQQEQEINLLTARKELLVAQEKLEKTRAEIQAIADQVNGEIAKGQNEQINNYGPAVLEALNAVHQTVTRPRRKIMKVQKVNGEYIGESIDAPDEMPAPEGVVQ